MSSLEDNKFASIRDVLGGFIGCSVLDITQHDREEFNENGWAYIEILFDNGNSLRFFSNPGFAIGTPAGIKTFGLGNVTET